MKLETAIALAFNAQSVHHLMESPNPTFYLDWFDLCDESKEIWIYLGVEVLENVELTEEQLKNKCKKFLQQRTLNDIRVFQNVLISLFEMIEDENVEESNYL